ncbi:sister chromatid cohesion protein Eso1 [Metarhizium album ARSEF 1941]|uniref:DNA polymerase eta n=1 Tax=Metarhizium album (strain ARSEF 1941) TaxID=1081103 RepID=A0A0B2WXE4_METAS|nr:sister chromatid cohesion protein Eso1 [Metarhizium album ARSEF 1941]KHO00942.1 sister chromatid cohesion protein Eso1 [Metarhizium album ARSEF 1941]
MASSPVAAISSPPDARPATRSRFTYRQLGQLASFNTSNPLRVIAHIDLDAFYAQCEMVRLGIPEDKPLAVQQWQGLIAVNYPARDWGIGRHCNVTEAKKLCPHLIAQHVATWREGDDKWAYRDDAAASIATDKVSLDPYRLESRKILALIRDTLPPNLQKVEKASIDEVFLDLSAHVHAVLLERYPELSNPAPYDDLAERLPLPSIAALDWKADALVDLEDDQESQDPDWDDVAILIGSEIVRHVRAQVRGKLGYTCSAGIANNKMVSKLGSGFKKPNSQTVVRGRAVHLFLADFKVTKIRNLGGKLGERVVSIFNTQSIKDLLQISLEQLKLKLGDDTGSWLHDTLRGIDNSEVNARTQIKSMLSAKSFRPSISTEEQALKWLRIFVGDIFSRLVEEGVLDNRRRPRSINLHHRHAGQTRSRQSPIPSGKIIDEQFLFHLARDLLAQILAEDKVWPCANLSLSVGGFEDGVKGNMGIGAFLVRGKEAASARSTSPEKRSCEADTHSHKKPRTTNDIQRFFSMDGVSNGQVPSATTGEDAPMYMRENVQSSALLLGKEAASPTEREAPENQARIASFLCARCSFVSVDAERLQSHEDWHMAKDIQDQESGKYTPAHKTSSSRNSAPKGSGAAPKRSREKGLEQGQQRLKFG